MTDTVRTPQLPVSSAGSGPAPPPSSHRRHPGDALRIAAGATVLAVALLAVQRDRLSTSEGDLFRLVNHLPSQASPVLVVVMQIGTLAGTTGAAAVMLVVARRHRRAALDLALAGTVAWCASRVVKNVVERPRPTGFLDDVLRFDGHGHGFVSSHAAVAAALATAAGPYLPRRWRRLVWALVWVVGFARVHQGAHLPLDVVGGIALGWMVGSTIHLLLGAPHREPGLDEAAAVARSGSGPRVSDLRRVPGVHRGSFPFTATAAGRPVFVKLLDPERRDRDWLHRMARIFAFRDVRDEAALLGPSDQAHREAAMTLLAAGRGARVPAVLGIERVRDQVWLVSERITGRDLDHLPTESVTDAVIRDAWMQVSHLHEARIAHRDLVASNVVVDDDGEAWIVDFAHATGGAEPRLLDNDVAELLASTSLLVGPRRAVGAAVDALGGAAVARALPELHALSLTAGTRRRLRASGEGLRPLRQQVAISTDLDVALVEPFRLRSGLFPITTVLTAVGTVVGLVLVAGPGDVADAVATPGLRWLGLAVLMLVAAEVSRATGMVAALDRRLAVGWTVVARLSSLSAAVLGGRRAGRDDLIGHLERSGIARPDSRFGLRELRRTRAVVGTLAGAAALWAGWRQELDLTWPDRLAWLVLLGVVAGAVQLVTARPGWTRAADDGDRPARRSVDWSALALLTGGEAAARVVVVVAATAAMGPGAPVAGVAMTHFACSAWAGRGPAAGAPGTGSIVMAVGLATFGMPLAPAVAAALASRGLLVWAPVAAGLLVRRGPLRRRLSP